MGPPRSPRPRPLTWPLSRPPRLARGRGVRLTPPCWPATLPCCPPPPPSSTTPLLWPPTLPPLLPTTATTWATTACTTVSTTACTTVSTTAFPSPPPLSLPKHPPPPKQAQTIKFKHALRSHVYVVNDKTNP